MGFTPDRELPIIWKIAVGSLRNKLLILLPGALLLSAFAPWAITPILMLGGAYLCFEAAEKMIEAFDGGPSRTSVAEALARSGRAGEAEGLGRDPHRPDPVGRDHGHRAGRRRGPAAS